MSTKHYRVRFLLTALLPLLFTAQSAMAQSRGQTGAISDEIISAQSIDEAGQRRVASYVQSLLPALRSEDPMRRQQARDALLDPLSRPRATASRTFRREFDRSLGDALTEMIADDSVGIAITAAMIAGPLATQSAYNAIAEGLDDSRAGVRYASARSAGAMLKAAEDGLAVVASQQIDTLLARLEATLASERQDVLVVLGVVQGLTAPEDDLRSRALTALARGMASQLQARRAGAVSSDVVETALNTIVIVRQELIAQAAGGDPDRDFARQSVLLAGQSMALVRELAGNPARERLDPDNVASLGIAAEGVALLAHESLTGARLPGQIQRAIEQARGGDRAALDRVVDEWVGAGGRLTRAPYNADADDFDA